MPCPWNHESAGRGCMPCPPGTWSDGRACIHCNFVHGPGCLLCDSRSELGPDGKTCECKAGYFGPDCAKCPEGLDCLGPVANVQPGYQNTSAYGLRATEAEVAIAAGRVASEERCTAAACVIAPVAKCYSHSACRGETCAEGSQGVLCDACKTGWHKPTSREPCQECPPPLTVLTYGTIVVVVVGGIALIFITLISAGQMMKAIGVRIAFNHLFVFSSVWLVCPVFHPGRAVGWPAPAEKYLLQPFLDYLTFVDAPQDAMKIDCLLHTLTQITKVEILPLDQMRLLLAAVAIPNMFCSLYLWARILDWCFYQITPLRPHLHRYATCVGGVMAWMMYTMNARELLHSSQCVSVSGVYVKRTNLSIRCGEYDIFWTLLGRFAAAFTIIGVPLIIAGVIRLNRNELMTPAKQKEIGFFYFGYQTKLTYWELIVYARKGLLLYMVVRPGEPGRELQVLVLLVIVVAVLIHALMDPFDNRNNQILDKLEAIGLGANAATVLVALTLELRPQFANHIFVDYFGLALALLPHAYFNWALVKMLSSFSLDPQSQFASVAALEIHKDAPALSLQNIKSGDREFLGVVLEDAIRLHLEQLDTFSFTYLEATLLSAFTKLVARTALCGARASQSCTKRFSARPRFPRSLTLRNLSFCTAGTIRCRLSPSGHGGEPCSSGS